MPLKKTLQVPSGGLQGKPQLMETPQTFWARCSDKLCPDVQAQGYTERRIGNSVEMVDQVLELVISGEKTGTFSLPGELARLGPLPRVGDYLVLTRFDGSAACLVLMESCEQVPFDEISQSHIQVEALAVRDLTLWRDFHRQYWGSVLAALGESFSEKQPILAQRFQLLEVALS